MKFTVETVEEKDNSMLVVDLHVSYGNDYGLRMEVGRLELAKKEFEALKFCMIEGSSRYMEREVAFEFIDNSKVPAYTKGA